MSAPVDLQRISPHDQPDVLASFWKMLLELDRKSDGDLLLRSWIDEWYLQWNHLTGENKKSSWSANVPKPGVNRRKR